MSKAVKFLKENKIMAVGFIVLGSLGILFVLHQIFAYDALIRPYLYDATAFGVPFYPNMTTNYVSGANMLMYFTILSNIFASVYLIMIGSAVFTTDKFKKVAYNPLLSGMVTEYIFITGLVYCTVLLPFVQSYPWNTGLWLNNLINYFQHIIMPVGMTVLFFFPLSDEKIELKQCPLFMVFPLCYLFVSEMRGCLAADHWFPYPFLNANQLWKYVGGGKPFDAAKGYAFMIFICLALLGVFIGLSYAIRALRKVMVKKAYGASDADESPAENKQTVEIAGDEVQNEIVMSDNSETAQKVAADKDE